MYEHRISVRIIDRGDRGYEIVTDFGRDENGKRRTKSRTFHGERAQAEMIRAETLLEYDGITADAVKQAPTIQQLGQAFIDQCRLRQRSPSTIRGYVSLANARVNPRIGHLQITALTTAMLDDWYDDMIDEGLANNTVRKCHSYIRSVGKLAVQRRLIRHNPATDASQPPVGKPQINPPTHDELQKIITAADERDELHGLTIRLAAVTGMRRGELIGLRVRDLTTTNDGAYLHVRTSVVYGETGGIAINDRTKNGNHRKVPIGQHTLQRLQRRTNQLPPNAFILSTAPDSSRPLHPDTVTDWWEQARTAADLPQYRLHDTRHYRATRMLDDGVPGPTVAEILGHSLDVLYRTYGHPIDSTSRRAADRNDTEFT